MELNKQERKNLLGLQVVYSVVILFLMLNSYRLMKRIDDFEKMLGHTYQEVKRLHNECPDGKCDFQLTLKPTNSRVVLPLCDHRSKR